MSNVADSFDSSNSNSDSTNSECLVPLPPMEHNLWGTPDESKELSASVQKLLHKLLGVGELTLHRRTTAQTELSPIRLDDADLAALGEIVGSGYVTTDKEQRIRRARGKSYPDLVDWRMDRVIEAPDAVVAPGTETEVWEVLKFCSREKIAVVPFGGGSSVVGGLSPKKGEMRAVISIDLRRFDQLEDVDLVSCEATFGAGLSGPHAELLLSKYGLQIGHYPQSFPYASLGGFAATRSSGQSSAGYGRFDEMVRSLRVVTPKGIMEVGWKAPMSAAGPDLRHVFLGSEGSFGIITKLRLQVHKIPQTKRYEAFRFPDFAAGAAAVRAVVQEGCGPTVIRLSDEIESSLNLSNTDSMGSAATSKVGCLCLTMFEGSENHTKSRHEETRAVLLAHGGTSLGEMPVREWEQGRFGAPVLRDGLIDNGAICETLETATDWSNITRLKTAVTEALTTELAKTGTISVVMCHISHVYAGGCSLYFTVVAAQKGDDPQAQWWPVKHAASQAIIDAGGTTTHHHGVGTDHRPFLKGEIGTPAVELIRAIKHELDPVGILNPEKLV